jgi:hypothetical protein
MGEEKERGRTMKKKEGRKEGSIRKEEGNKGRRKGVNGRLKWSKRKGREKGYCRKGED